MKSFIPFCMLLSACTALVASTKTEKMQMKPEELQMPMPMGGMMYMSFWSGNMMNFLWMNTMSSNTG